MIEDPQHIKIVVNKIELMICGFILGACMKFGEIILVKILMS